MSPSKQRVPGRAARSDEVGRDDGLAVARLERVERAEPRGDERRDRDHARADLRRRHESRQPIAAPRGDRLERDALGRGRRAAPRCSHAGCALGSHRRRSASRSPPEPRRGRERVRAAPAAHSSSPAAMPRARLQRRWAHRRAAPRSPPRPPAARERHGRVELLRRAFEQVGRIVGERAAPILVRHRDLAIETPGAADGDHLLPSGAVGEVRRPEYEATGAPGADRAARGNGRRSFIVGRSPAPGREHDSRGPALPCERRPSTCSRSPSRERLRLPREYSVALGCVGSARARAPASPGTSGSRPGRGRSGPPPRRPRGAAPRSG